MVIAIDFDGTMVRHEYPLIGEEVPNAVKVMKRLSLHGHQLILWTMRGGEELRNAIQWCIEHGIQLYGVNRNPEQTWTESPKCYAQLYIDDAALGCPLVIDDPNVPNKSDRPYVNWEEVEEQLEIMGVLPPTPDTYTQLYDN